MDIDAEPQKPVGDHIAMNSEQFNAVVKTPWGAKISQPTPLTPEIAMETTQNVQTSKEEKSQNGNPAGFDACSHYHKSRGTSWQCVL